MSGCSCGEVWVVLLVICSSQTKAQEPEVLRYTMSENNLVDHVVADIIRDTGLSSQYSNEVRTEYYLCGIGNKKSDKDGDWFGRNPW